MADNIILSAGSGGSTVRTLSDSGAVEWPASVICYATATTPGAATFQFVGTAAGLPVAQQGTWNVTVNTALPAGTNVIGHVIVDSGSVTATGSGNFTVVQSTAASLNATVVGTGTFAVQAAQSGTWNVGTVTTLTGITNAVTVAQATASSLNATVVGTGTFAVQAAQSGTWNIGTVTTVTTVSAVTSITNPVAATQSGTWNIGTVTTLTGITNALPAGTNLLGQIAAGQQIASLYNGTTAVTPQYATFSTSASGATTVVSAVGGKKIYVLRWSVSSNGATNVNLQSHTTTAQATGLRYLTQFASGGGAYCPAGIMATATGEALDVNNSNAVAISGEVTYVQI